MAEKVEKIKNEKPQVAEEQEPKKLSEKTHIVKEGDTLRHLAIKYLGRSSRMREIRAINHLATDILTVGRELIIPEK